MVWVPSLWFTSVKLFWTSTRPFCSQRRWDTRSRRISTQGINCFYADNLVWEFSIYSLKSKHHFTASSNNALFIIHYYCFSVVVSVDRPYWLSLSRSNWGSAYCVSNFLLQVQIRYVFYRPAPKIWKSMKLLVNDNRWESIIIDDKWWQLTTIDGNRKTPNFCSSIGHRFPISID